MLSERRLAVVVTSGDFDTLLEMTRTAGEATEAGAAVRVFFRDESIPAICRPEVALRLIPAGGTPPEASVSAVSSALARLAASGDARLYACSSSLYVWGVNSADLIPPISGARGLIAFLAEDLAGATDVMTY